jgi:hypothetical protein
MGKQQLLLADLLLGGWWVMGQLTLAAGDSHMLFES